MTRKYWTREIPVNPSFLPYYEEFLDSEERDGITNSIDDVATKK